ncbi:hypothetical protein [Leptospira noguchii]|uniref:hypothetical protein n=1 Tax=Leptospira noguchii TaxID=28182 RepID=UPI001FB59256|nr:hypothetical protein [Leptospira noguchii]UOG54686.1 hypothetical protein MAL09_20855 [Leptospira noguchii]
MSYPTQNVGKLNTTLTMDRVVGPIFLQRICRNSHTDLNVCGVGYDFLIWSFEVTQRLTSIGVRSNSASHFYWRSK